MAGGTAPIWAPTLFGMGMTFGDTTSGYLSITDQMNLPKHSVTALVNMAGMTGKHYIIEKSEGSTSKPLYLWRENGGRVYAGFHGANGWHDLISNATGTSWTDGWHLITYTYDGAVQCLYRDGVLDKSQAQTDTPDAGNGNCTIGSNHEHNAGWNNQIALVMLHQRALLEPEVRLVYADPFALYRPSQRYFYAPRPFTGSSRVYRPQHLGPKLLPFGVML